MSMPLKQNPSLPSRRNAIIKIATYSILAGTSSAFAQINSSFDQSYAAWDALLKNHVKWLPDGKQSRVNYKGFAQDRAKLKNVLDSFSAVPKADFDKWSREQQMVFLINAHNAFTIEIILTKYPNLKSINDIGWLLHSTWQKKFFTLLGEKRTLDWLADEQIHTRYNDPRSQIAVNVASISGPALAPETYTPAKVYAQMDDGMARFLSDRTRNRMANGKLEVSQVFSWFLEGNKGPIKLEDVFAKYAEQLTAVPAEREKLKAKSVAVSYLDYDWSLNDLGR